MADFVERRIALIVSTVEERHPMPRNLATTLGAARRPRSFDSDAGCPRETAVLVRLASSLTHQRPRG
jgi:hypothetical protein